MCKHCYAVRFWLTVNFYESMSTNKPKVLGENVNSCYICGSVNTIRYGKPRGKQWYYCKDCNRKFTEYSLLKKARYKTEIKLTTLELYFDGLSLRKISAFWGRYDLSIPFQTIAKWIRKVIDILNQYTSTLVPQLGRRWNEDEMKVKKKGGEVEEDGSQYGWLWNVLDKSTRFLLACEMSMTRNEVDAMKAFLKAKATAKVNPSEIVTDKLASLPRGIERAFINDAVMPKHTVIKSGAGTPNANEWAERFNNTVRERTKTQRGWKSDDALIRLGMLLWFNFLRPNQGLKGLTPAEMAGLYQASGPNRIAELLRNATAQALDATIRGIHQASRSLPTTSISNAMSEAFSTRGTK